MSIKSNVAVKIGLTDINWLSQALYNISFGFQNYFDFNFERRQLIKLVRRFTHVNYKRLKALYDLAEKCHQSGCKGAFVETGVWKGGCAGILSYMSKKYNYQNQLWFFDSFEGLPEPTIEDGLDAEVFSGNNFPGSLKPTGKVEAGEKYIKELLFNKLSIKPEKVHIIKGWFQKTLPKERKKIGQIALLRLDGDWYESTMAALENLYRLVVSGGYVVIDDYYYWDGCRRAVDDFFKKNKIKAALLRQDMSGVYFQKP